MRKSIVTVGLLALAMALSVQATDAPSTGKGAFITAGDIKALLATKDMAKTSDNMMKLIDGNTAHVGMAVVHRPSNPNVGDNYLQHTNVIEIYYVLQGGATMTIGGTLTGANPFPAGPNAADAAIGPGFRGTGAEPGGETRMIGPGDVVIIPAGATHYFSSINDITYICFRIDPTKKAKLVD